MTEPITPDRFSTDIHYPLESVILDPCHWLLIIGYWLLVIGYWLLVMSPSEAHVLADYPHR